MKTLRILATAAILAVVAPAIPAFAHPGGHGEETVTISRANAEAKAKTIVETMISRGLLEASWKGLNPSSADLREGASGGLEWVVTFKNPAAKVAAKRTLYVFLSNDGIYLAANHTGN
jgi:uncharacterized cupredoxin-like copper-binding protein